jgi:AraC-like DNA-binding protein/mannose-6-phosphate isomerase-like protein (cupin superfamily)
MNTVATSTDRVMLDFSDYGLAEIRMVGRYDYTHAHPPLRKHLHQEVFEVCVLQRGTQTYFIGNERFDLSAGDMIIIHPGEAHGTDTEPENRGRLYWVQIQRPARNRSFLGLSPRTARQLLEPLTYLPCRQFHNCDVLFRTFEHLLSPVSPATPKALAKASVQNLLLRLLLDIQSLTLRKVQQACSPGVKLALQHLDTHCGDHLTIAQLASAAGTSESYLKAHFKREVGMTPMEYLMWLRIEKAKRALRESDILVTELSLHSGFATSQHFATVFKRLTGHSPRDYRRLAGGEPSVDNPPISGKGILFHPAVAERPRK